MQKFTYKSIDLFHLGSTVRESCGTEPTTLTNFINSMSISLLNSTVDQTRFRNGVTGLLMSEMASGSPPSAIPSVQVNPIPSIPTPNAYTPQPPVIVVQPPAQQIYFNQPSTGSDYGYSYDTSRPERSPSKCSNLIALGLTHRFVTMEKYVKLIQLFVIISSGFASISKWKIFSNRIFQNYSNI